MPRSGGVYTLPAGNPVVTLTVISSTWANTTMSDIATALTGSLPVDGSAPMSGQLRLADGTVGAPGLTWGTETTSGWYRIGANDFGFSVAATKVLEVTKNALTVTGANGSAAAALRVQGGTTAGDAGLSVLGGTAAADFVAVFKNAANTITVASLQATGAFSLGWNGGASSLAGNASGALTIATPSVGDSLTISAALANSNALHVIGSATSGQSFGILINAGTTAADNPFRVNNQNNSAALFSIDGAGNVNVPNGSGGLSPVYSGAPRNVQNANYTFTLADANKFVYHSGGANTWIIPANSVLPFPPGTFIYLMNLGAGAVSLQITGDSIIWLPSGATGNRTLNAAACMATLWKIDATTWGLSGVGLS